MSNKVLYFYDNEDFYGYKKIKLDEGIEIISISTFIESKDITEYNVPANQVIDISVLTEYQNIQLLGERYIRLLQENEEIEFICEISKKGILEKSLRFVFNSFEDIDKTFFQEKLITKSKENITKIHRKITDLNDDELNVFFQVFNNKLYGHQKFKDDFVEQVHVFRIFNRLKEHKILSLFLMGESGVGKTEVARSIFESLGGKTKLAKINFGNYSNEYSLSSLIGSARGYIGSEDGEIFMRVRDSDVGVLLIDEFEKSNATLFNYFLDVLESGKMISSLGKEIDLNGFIIIFTSNIPKEDFSKVISPELRSRFDYKCLFTLLSEQDKQKYIEFRAKVISEKAKSEYGIELGEDFILFLHEEINVSLYNNMRDINRQIKKAFLKFIRLNYSK